MESPYLCIAFFSTGGIQINGLKGTSLLLNVYVGGRVHITEADIQNVTLDASRNAEIQVSEVKNSAIKSPKLGLAPVRIAGLR